MIRYARFLLQNPRESWKESINSRFLLQAGDVLPLAGPSHHCLVGWWEKNGGEMGVIVGILV